MTKSVTIGGVAVRMAPDATTYSGRPADSIRELFDATHCDVIGNVRWNNTKRIPFVEYLADFVTLGFITEEDAAMALEIGQLETSQSVRKHLTATRIMEEGA
jgi:hypothetical protein